MTVYLVLALILINGQPQIKGGVHPTRDACDTRRAEILDTLTVQRISPCEPIDLDEVTPFP